VENLLRGRKIYEPPRFMTVNQAVEQLLEVEEKRKDFIATKTTIGVGLCRVGADDQQVLISLLVALLEAFFQSLDAFFDPLVHGSLAGGRWYAGRAPDR